MKRFKITYFDPDEEDFVDVIKSFEDTGNISAEEWAEDYAYTIADKRCDYVITELFNN